jgi:putative peptidoglycan lipid II flippase
MGLSLFAAQFYRADLEALVGAFRLPGLGPKEIVVLLLCLAGAAIYPPLLLASGGVTLAEVKAALRRRPGVTAPPPADVL